MTKLSLFQQHCERWKDGCGASICEGARKVFCRGKLPCDLLIIGEGPGECISGDTLIDTAYRDKSVYPDGIPIIELVGKSGFPVYCFDDKTRKLALGTVKKVWKTGYRPVYKVSFMWWGAPPDGKGGRQQYYDAIKVTDNHPFLLRSGKYLSIAQGLKCGYRLQPFYRFGGNRFFVGTHSTKMQNEAIFLLGAKLGRRLIKGEQTHHKDRNPSNDSWDNLECLTISEHARLHGLEDNAMFNPEHRETHRKVMESKEYRANMSNVMKEVLSDPEVYAARLAQVKRDTPKIRKSVKKKFDTDPVYYYRFLRGRQKCQNMCDARVAYLFKKKFPNVEFPPEDDNHEIISIEKCPAEDVYDMEVDKYHNFVANGVFVHNSEEAVGQPFVGPAGKLLDYILEQALPGHTTLADSGKRVFVHHLRIAFTNIVCCIPREEDGVKATEPDDDSVLACQPRLVEFVEIAKPKLIVCVGAMARDWLAPGYAHSVPIPRSIPRIDIMHPAAILRANLAVKGLLVQKVVANLRNAVEEYFPRVE